ncbi:MAG TPA: 3-hydroxyacyl-CoA dehydrogenase family protein [Kofleriaceae bacterium]|jgi:3-hydroxyacyl-CoA dehydrogenase|nr:3-hydroxyacyl-CoA dehydrogenase family protein [Kofleriaceae bacterium]
MGALTKVVVLGANGAMGSGSGAVFAAAGIPTVFLARTADKAAAGRARAESMVKSTAISRFITVGSYDELERHVAGADLIFEAVAEELAIKREFFARVDKARKPDSIVATVSSGLSIAAMCASTSASFQRHFLGIHFFNPPNVIVGCELIPHAGTDPQITARVRELLAGPLGREVIETSDTPAFCGNRVGFKVLNECAQLAETHGVAFVDALIGPHTGRAMTPLVTIDFVGWDVHQAIVDNLYANTNDEAHAAFALPAYMGALIAAGHLGNKTKDKGGFFRMDGKTRLVLDPATQEYAPAAKVELPSCVEQMKSAIRVGRYGRAMDAMCDATGDAATLLRRVVLGYVSYGLSRVGEVVAGARDVDRIMGFGFNWAPPSVLVDAIGARRTIALLDKAKLPVPRVIVDAAEKNTLLFDEPAVDRGRFFYAA